MRTSLSKSLAAGVLLSVAFLSAQAQLPKRDLVIEVRQVDSRDGNRTQASVVGTQPRAAALVAQRVVVRNGEKATLRFNVSMPVQWVQRIDSQAVGPQIGASGQSSGTGMTNAVTWMDAGQSMVVTPRWTSAKQPVSVEIEILTAAVEDSNGAELPSQMRSQTATTVSAPIGEWVTIATQGQASQAGVYTSAPSGAASRAIELRVTLN
jgi:hypothetical protein